MTRRTSSRGFTLIEIMVVVLIISLLAALVGQQVLSRWELAKVEAAKTQIKSFDQAVRTFRLDTGRYPSPAEGLAILVPPPPTTVRNYDREGYLEDLPEDPWGHPYEYSSDGYTFRILSYGRDGLPGGDGYDQDLTNQRRAHAETGSS